MTDRDAMTIPADVEGLARKIVIALMDYGVEALRDHRSEGQAHEGSVGIVEEILHAALATEAGRGEPIGGITHIAEEAQLVASNISRDTPYMDAIIEECARVCDGLRKEVRASQWASDNGHNDGIYACAAAIRALKSQQPATGETEECIYCGEWYFRPISYHHSTEECRENEARNSAPPQLQGEVGAGMKTPADFAKLWLWKNFVDGRPEYWGFDNPYPCHSNGDPMTLGEPCGFVIPKSSIRGRSDVSDEQVVEAIKRSLARKESGEHE